MTKEEILFVLVIMVVVVVVSVTDSFFWDGVNDSSIIQASLLRLTLLNLA